MIFSFLTDQGCAGLIKEHCPLAKIILNQILPIHIVALKMVSIKSRKKREECIYKAIARQMSRQVHHNDTCL